ncbi:thiosulfate oxidation carrier protein SoxY [Bradyrhizobium sp. CCBAU 051011]|nr:thiosulfate oxidation carrier protein SoxY [Bradyrhizobium sp. CCBAU 051011]QHO72707.1 thiosulfate oxidation carrier protein SoxY [Bradyrhizobium sp. CCBAU 051011]
MNTMENDFSATRRLILKGAGVLTLIGLGIASLDVTKAFAAANDKYPEDAFKQKSDADVIKTLYGKTAEPSDKVKLDAPEIAENGSVVPISVSTTLGNVTSIAFLVSENPNVLIAKYNIPAGTMPNVANRIKMAKTSNVTVLVEAGGKLYSASKEVKVTVGGCGG